jgi:4-hydroxybenzoate polyprenyltransferase
MTTLGSTEGRVSPLVTSRPAPAVPPADPQVGYAATPSVGVSPAKEWVRLLRCHHWVKNGFVLAPLLFSGRAESPTAIGHAALAFAAFCFLASGMYCWNDIADRVADRAHPMKRMRPVARGTISVTSARLAGGVVTAGALIVGVLVGRALVAVLLAYLALNLAYWGWLKRMVLLDVFALAALFVLRLLAGTAAIGVHPSVWLLLCGGLLSLYLGFAKRRYELELLGGGSVEHRSVLGLYDVALLDQISTILLAVTIVAYVMYTLESPTARVVGEQTLSYSTVFVLYGVLRYVYLVRRREGGAPTETLLADRPLLAAVIAWGAYCAWVIYRPF